MITPQIEGKLWKPLPHPGASARNSMDAIHHEVKAEKEIEILPSLQCSFHLHPYSIPKKSSRLCNLGGLSCRPGSGILCGASADPDHSFPQALSSPEMDQRGNVQHAGAPFATCQMDWGGPSVRITAGQIQLFPIIRFCSQ